MKQLHLFCILLIAIICLSCSSDDDAENPSIQEQNGFTFENNFYPTDFLYLTDNNNQPDFEKMGFFLSNFEFGVDCEIDNGQYVVLEFSPDQSSNVFEQRTYSSNDLFFIDKIAGINARIDDTCFIEEVDFIANEAEPGLDSSSIEIKVISINQTSIEIEFKMVREDGAEIIGYYAGDFEYGNFF